MWLTRKNKKNKKKAQEPQEEPQEQPEATEAPDQSDPVQELQEKLDAQHEAHLRLAAEYDNFRKRTQKEKEASYANGKAATIGKFLPIYDNLERALNQPTEDAPLTKKGVEMTMAELEKIFQGLGVSAYGQAGDAFDPNLHNAVMHIEDESPGKTSSPRCSRRASAWESGSSASPWFRLQTSMLCRGRPVSYKFVNSYTLM